jgi:hypothetical protein
MRRADCIACLPHGRVKSQHQLSAGHRGMLLQRRSGTAVGVGAGPTTCQSRLTGATQGFVCPFDCTVLGLTNQGRPLGLDGRGADSCCDTPGTSLDGERAKK